MATIIYTFSVDSNDRRTIDTIETWKTTRGFNFSLKIRSIIENDELKQREMGSHEYELQQHVPRLDQYYKAAHGITLIQLYKSKILDDDDIYHIYKSARLALHHIDWNRDIQQIVKDKMYEEKRGDRKTVEESR